MKYALENELKTVCVTDHFWDESLEGASEDFYAPQNFAHISRIKPLPQADGVRFLFGCETDLNKNLTLGISKERFDQFDFVIIPTTHFQMKDYTLSEEEYKDSSARAAAWVKRLDAVLNMDLPFHKIGIAHLTCHLIAPDHEILLETLDKIPHEEMKRLFTKAAKLGVGIELNFSADFPENEAEILLRPYRIAKECGCKFYFGSDAHHPNKFANSKANFKKIVDMLKLTEEDKFVI